VGEKIRTAFVNPNLLHGNGIYKKAIVIQDKICYWK